ncbi:putative acyl-CoA dehydrogenase YdbM [Teleopsis dalmanni]|uniref:putative acyl-CoA dehydrogenase YdbM n=1 Tax=Teleopsis dalmanni TaxID=139649 RepID=UPI0018CDFF98|nr:putative acyl-CoA dehydrogenase YdbM [Teleopsis dalmanni]
MDMKDNAITMTDFSLNKAAAGADGYKSAADILAAVEKLGPLIAQEADEVDRLRHLTPRLLAALKDAGVFRIAWPAAWGGPEMRFEDQIRLVEMLSYHDASVAWNVQILSDTGFYGGQFPEDVARTLYTSMDNATAGGFYPPQRADKVPGGWHIKKARWPFGSGIHSADVIVGGVQLFENGTPILDETGAPEFRVAYLPKEKVSLLDTWHVHGLHGSGSTDYMIEDVTIPDAKVFKYFDGQASHLPPLSRYADLIAQSLQGVVLGLGRRILDDVKTCLQRKSPNDRLIRSQYAEAEMNYRAARAYSMGTATMLSDRLLSGGMLDDSEYMNATLASVNAGHQIHKACTMALELVGAYTIYEASGFVRRRRDLDALLVHISHQRKALQNPGAKLLGETDLVRLA